MSLVIIDQYDQLIYQRETVLLPGEIHNKCKLAVQDLPVVVVRVVLVLNYVTHCSNSFEYYQS